MIYILPTQGGSRTTFRISWPILHPSAARACGLGQINRHLDTWRPFNCLWAIIRTSVHHVTMTCQVTATYSSKLKAKKNGPWSILSSRYWSTPYSPRNPLTGKVWLINTIWNQTHKISMLPTSRNYLEPETSYSSLLIIGSVRIWLRTLAVATRWGHQQKNSDNEALSEDQITLNAKDQEPTTNRQREPDEGNDNELWTIKPSI